MTLKTLERTDHPDIINHDINRIYRSLPFLSFTGVSINVEFSHNSSLDVWWRDACLSRKAVIICKRDYLNTGELGGSLTSSSSQRFKNRIHCCETCF